MTQADFAWPKNILVALALDEDFTPDGEPISLCDTHLIEQSIWFAEQVGAKLTFFNCLEATDTLFPSMDRSSHEVLRAERSERLEGIVARAKASGVKASWLIDVGRAWYRTIIQVQANDHDLVMVGPHDTKLGWIQEMAYGSTTDRLLRQCPVPVWVESSSTKTPPERILVPVDFSPLSLKTLRVAEAFRKLNGMECFALHCPDFPNDFALRRLPNADEAISEYHREVRVAARQQTERALEDVGADGDSWSVLIGDAPLVEIIRTTLEKNEIDMLIMGSVARTGLRGFFTGNTAEKILRRINSPVWVAKPDGWTGPV